MCIHKLCLFKRAAVRSAASRLPCQCGLAATKWDRPLARPNEFLGARHVAIPNVSPTARLNDGSARPMCRAHDLECPTAMRCAIPTKTGMSDDRRIRVGHNLDLWRIQPLLRVGGLNTVEQLRRGCVIIFRESSHGRRPVRRQLRACRIGIHA